MLPRIRAMRINATVHDFTTRREDATIGLNKCGLFSLTLGALTSGCSQNGRVELTELARNLGVKEERKALWEGFQVGICGLTSADFRACFDDIKHTLQDAGFPIEAIQIVFSHAIIGLPKSGKLLLPILQQLKDALVDAGLRVDTSGDFKSDTFELMFFEHEAEVWNVFSAFSDELQWDRDETCYTPQLRAQLKCELEQLIEKAKVKVEIKSEGEEKVEPPMNISPMTGKNRHYNRDLYMYNSKVTKSARFGHMHRQVAMGLEEDDVQSRQ